MTDSPRRVSRAWAELPTTSLDEALAGASRRGELDRLLADAGEDVETGQLLTWSRALLAAAAIALVSFGAWQLLGGSDSFTAALQTVRVAQRTGAPVPVDAAAHIRDRLADASVAQLVLQDPFSASAFDEAATSAGPLRGPSPGPAVTGITLLRPRAAVRSFRPEFRLVSGLPDDSTWQIVVRVRHAGTGRELSWTVEQPAGHPGELVFRPSSQHQLMPGTWRVELQLSPMHDLSWGADHGEFVIPEPATLNPVLNLSVDGEQHTETLVHAAALLSRNLAAEALATLESLDDTDATTLLLRVRAHALLGESRAITALRDRWRELVVRPN